MRYQSLPLVLCLLLSGLGCAKEDIPVAVPPMPEDLSTWSAPTPWTPPPPPDVPKPVPPRPAAPNEQLYVYEVSKEYEVPVPMGIPADVILEAGETVHAYVGGDRTPLAEGEGPPWEVKQSVSGSGDDQTPHFFFTAARAGLRQGITITTDRRVYYLTVKSVEKSKVRAVRWTYPHTLHKEPKREPLLWPEPGEPHRLHVGYKIETPEPRPDWIPTVTDDGQKTYLLFSPVVLYTEMPLVRIVGPHGPQVLNSRQVGPVLIIDRLVPRLELRYGTGESAPVVRITRGHLLTITCPGDGLCPAFPATPGGLP